MRGVLSRGESTKIVLGRDYATDPAGGAYNAPPDPLFSWEGKSPPHSTPPHYINNIHYTAPYAFGVSVSAPTCDILNIDWTQPPLMKTGQTGESPSLLSRVKHIQQSRANHTIIISTSRIVLDFRQTAAI